MLATMAKSETRCQSTMSEVRNCKAAQKVKAVVMLTLWLATVARGGPVDFGRQELGIALEKARLTSRADEIKVRVTPTGVPESFRIELDGQSAVIEGGDAAGAMYGELELAERVRLKGGQAWAKGVVTGTPFLRDRGLNIFLTLPWDYEANKTDYTPEALNDPNKWWFQNDDYWRMLFNSMARHRLNWLDIHGTWDVSVTDAPNLYAYFIQSDKYPAVGVAPVIKARNLRHLNKVIGMAHERGIRLSLMAYEASLRIPRKREVLYPDTEQVAYEYTREVVEKMIRQAPALDAIGYRIGESGKGESFFRCYQEAVKASGKDSPLLTHTWLTRKAQVLPLAQTSDDYSTQIKYNGEQWGPPYFVAGGRMAGWYSYSFEDYLSYSGAGPAAKMWPGSPAPGGGTWPPEPYKPIWQVRANGTHRIFPFYQPDWVRRTIKTMKLGTASGYTVEPLNAYYPDSPRYYVANSNDLYAKWILERDEPYLMLWGRCGYDPNTPEAAFDLWFRDQFGEQGVAIAGAWKTASKIIPTAYTIYSLGPDHRNHNPEMELGGDVAAFIVVEPFDSFSVMSVKEALSLSAVGGKDGRVPSYAYANRLAGYATEVRSGLAGISVAGLSDPAAKRLKELREAMLMLSHLGDYYAGRLESAYWQARSEQSGVQDNSRVRAALARSRDAWGLLCDSPEANYYKPFTEPLRMHTNAFHWRSELPALQGMLDRLPAAQGEASPSGELPAFARAPKSAVLSWTTDGEDIVCTVPAEGLTQAWLLTKPLPSTTFFHKVPMEKKGDVFEARFTRMNCGHMVAADVQFEGHLARVPSWEETDPYLVIPSLAKPTPMIYSSEEAMSYLAPEVLTPEKYGTLLIPTRGYRFFRHFDVATQRKILDPVSRGMRLVVLQQLYGESTYPLRWLPVPPRVASRQADLFDPGDALGLPQINAPGILWQPFLPTPGWELFGNGGVARYKLGKGEIWLIQARAFQLAHYPTAAQFLAKVVSLDKSKPVVLLDHCGEGADTTSSYFTDLMNALEVPFLTLGEVIAREQGMDSFKKIPGKVTDDAVLQGKGPRIMKDFLYRKVKALAARPLPATKDELEGDKPNRKKELMRCLGLDPLPPRTPLKAEVTGVIKRNGYRIEKIVFESRPNFPVTGHLYIPDGPPGTKYPVILNPHGHWTQKKMEPTVQLRLIAQALGGYLAFIIDSPGWSFEGTSLIERRSAGCHWDFPLVEGSANATAIYVWDQMRALDYLATRPEADMTRVGLTGASGGGLAAMYEFAADERITCAVLVVYPTSLEINPDNGCACNHVPGVLQIGDRSDIIAIRAPAPVFVIGARQDAEFPPAGTQLTGEKLKKIWGLYGAADSTGWQIFEGPHDYNQLMRERAMGFFDKSLKGKGDGSPVPEPALKTEDPNDPQFLALPQVPKGSKTMRDIARENLATAGPVSFADVVRLNGGVPKRASLDFKVISTDGRKSAVTFQSEPGLTIPGLLWLPEGTPKGAVVLVSEGGKIAAATEFDVPALLAAGYACLAIDARGTGELQGLDIRLMTYLGTAPAFAMAVDALAAVEAMRRYSPKMAVLGAGLGGAQVPLFTALMDPSITYVAGLQGMKSYSEVLDLPEEDKGVNYFAIQPCANSGAPLETLKALVKCPADWNAQGERDPDLVARLAIALAAHK
jgi:cephalosporin-C deacetylase-like acetyl esterase